MTSLLSRETTTALLAGLLFGAGLHVSGMTDPAKVLAFLDILGAWDPSLAFVMGGALAVTATGYRVLRKRGAALHMPHVVRPRWGDFDRRLVAGSLLFGVGWGLAGYCPGPAFAAIAFGAPETLLFVAAMLASMAITRASLAGAALRTRAATLPGSDG